MIGLAWLVGGVLGLFLLVVIRGAPYVPSRRADIERAFTELYPVGTDDVVVDLGSGDGVVLRQAAKRGARAVGYELNPVLVLLSRWLSRRQPLVSVRLADVMLSDLPADTTLVYVFSTSRDIEKVGHWVEQKATLLGRPIYLLSYGFRLKREAVRQSGAYSLYSIGSLQPTKDTV